MTVGDGSGIKQVSCVSLKLKFEGKGCVIIVRAQTMR